MTPNQWKRERLNSEKCIEHPGYSCRRTEEMCRTNRDQWCWAALRLCFNPSHYFSKPFNEILDILSYVFVHVDVWYFNHKRRFRLVILAPRICAAQEPSLSRTRHAVGPHLSRGFVPSRADASRGSIEKSVNRGFAKSRNPRFPSGCRGFEQLGRDTQAVNPASIHLCPIAHV